MKILLSGIGGHMGAEVLKLAGEGYRGAKIIAGVDPMGCSLQDVPCYKSFAEVPEEICRETDLIVDFSHHSGTEVMVGFALQNRLPLVVATTGQTPEERGLIEQAAAEIPVFFAANFSMGIALLIDLAKKAAAALPEAEIEIVEAHHDRKIDAPSGTALAIAKALQEVRPEATIHSGRSGMEKRTKEEIGIAAIRMGNLAGMHEVLIGTPNQTITLKHETHSRALFAEGALAAADFLKDQPAGLYDMNTMISRL